MPSKTAHRILAQLLIDTDVLHVPVRFSYATTEAVSAVFQRRRQYRLGGIPLQTGGGTNARQEAFKAVRELISAGLVKATGVGTSRLLKLTEYGDNYVRSLIPSTPRLDLQWPSLEKVRAAELDPRTWKNTGFVWERHVVYGPDHVYDPGDGRPLIDFEHKSTVFIVNGLMDSMTDACGCLGYKTTEAGRAALEQGRPEPPDHMPEVDDELTKWEIDEYCRAEQERSGWKPANRNDLAIPLSHGLWGPDDVVEAATVEAK